MSTLDWYKVHRIYRQSKLILSRPLQDVVQTQYHIHRDGEPGVLDHPESYMKITTTLFYGTFQISFKITNLVSCPRILRPR